MARYWNDGSYDREELNADNRRKVMDVWKRFESSKTGVWLSRHTHLLERLSDEESHLVVRAGAMVCVFALILSMIMFLLVKGGMLAWTLLTLPVFAIAFMLVMVLWIFWDAYRDSGERAADWLSTRPGVATWRQIAADYGPRAVNRDVLPSVLPRMLEDFRYRKPGAIRPRPWHAAWYVGDSWNMEVWLGSERHIYVLGPTRSGKTVSVVIPSVVEAPGFVLATSTRGDIIKTTRYLRECGVKDRVTGASYGGRGAGTTHIFDPEGVAENDPDTRHNMRWTPLQGCDDPAVAMRRAQTMVAIGGMGSGSNNQEWGVSATMYVQAMLYAAAIADRTINDCYRWSLSPEAAQEAADLIRKYTPEREMDRWAATLNALPHVDPRQKGSEWFGVKNAFSILADPNVRARMNLSPSDPRLIDPKRMVLRGDTVYVLSKPRRDGGVAGNAGIFVSLRLARQDRAPCTVRARRTVEHREMARPTQRHHPGRRQRLPADHRGTVPPADGRREGRVRQGRGTDRVGELPSDHAQGRVRRRDVEMVDQPDRHAPPYPPRILLESGTGTIGRSDHSPRT